MGFSTTELVEDSRTEPSMPAWATFESEVVISLEDVPALSRTLMSSCSSADFDSF